MSDDDDRRRTLLAVVAAREAAHRRAALALAPVTAALASGFPADSLRAAVTPDDPYRDRRRTAADTITQHAMATGVLGTWRAVLLDAHTDALVGGAAAAAHHYSGGVVPVTSPRPDTPDTFQPDPWLDLQTLGLGGDLALLLGRDDVTDDDLTDALAAGEGAELYLDVQMSTAWLLGSESQYGAFGVDLLNWITVGDERVCLICVGYEAGSPYVLGSEPWTPHPRCRCWIEPA